MYDPAAMSHVEKAMSGVRCCNDAYEAALGADLLATVTDWPEFGDQDHARIRDGMNRPVIVDGRNMLTPQTMRDLGFVYQGMGR